MERKEDRSPPISEEELKHVLFSDNHDDRLALVQRILYCLNEKRDSYQGLTTTIISIIDSQNQLIIDSLCDSILESLTTVPMRFNGKVFLTKVTPQLINLRPLFIIDLYEQIIERSHKWRTTMTSEMYILRLQIISLKTIKQAELARGGRLTKLTVDLIDQLSLDAINRGDDTTKIDTLSLILEQRSTTLPISERDLSLYKVLLNHSLSLQEQALRQIFVALTNKLIKRIKDSSRVVNRDTKKYSDEERQIINLRYLNFIEAVTKLCFDSIYCNAYFGSFIVTMSTLKFIIQHITFEDKNFPIQDSFRSRRCYDSILGCLNDSFEENKANALDLLLKLPFNNEFYHHSNLDLLEKIAYQLVESVNPPHSLTCQFVFKLVIELRSKLSDDRTRNQYLYQHIYKLIELIEEALNDSQDNNPLTNKPVYPKLSCLKALLSEVIVTDLGEDRDKWRPLIKRLVSASIKACQAVSMIVCNLNPETIGHLPMDLTPLDTETLSKCLKVSLNISGDDVSSSITSQMLLICGWKTIKETSLILGTVCKQFWWPTDTVGARKKKIVGSSLPPVLERSDMIEIIGFFDSYLRNLRHRGAFEQAYNGFIMITQRVWCDKEFRDILTSMLNQILDCFKEEVLDKEKVDCLKAYVTRRSAGLPFMVQAILISAGDKASSAIQSTVDCLLEILNNPVSKEYQRIHCLNILKAIIKEHNMGEQVLDFVGPTFAVTMDAFSSTSFSIRNCASMLLKATTDRTFGVNRLRDSIHRRNQLSFENFFTRCPGLDQRMIEHLENARRDRRYLAAAHAVFILLFRLRPSLNPSDGFSEEKIIQPFLLPVRNLALECPDLKLRTLAASLSIRLDSFCKPDVQVSNRQNLESIISTLIIVNEPLLTLDLNRFHGALMMVRCLIDIIPEQNCKTNMDETLKFAFMIVESVFSSRYSDYYPNILKSAALDIAESCCIVDPTQAQVIYGIFITTLCEKYLPNPDEPFCSDVLFKCASQFMIASSTMDIPTERNITPIYGTNRSQMFILKLLADEYLHPNAPPRNISSNLHASLLRLARQVLSYNRSETYLDKLMSKLDVESISAHATPFDRLSMMSDHDAKRDRLLRYCSPHKDMCTPPIKPLLERVNRLVDYPEFYHLEAWRTIFPSDTDIQSRVKRGHNCNTPRMVETLAFVIQFWDDLDPCDRFEYWNRMSPSDTLHFICLNLQSMPDCDVKCLMLLFASKFITCLLNRDCISDDIHCAKKFIVQFTSIVDDLSDGDHGLTIRESCMHVLEIMLPDMVSKCSLPQINSPSRCQASLINLSSAAVKLNQDEDLGIRATSETLLAKLCDKTITVDSNQTVNPQNRLDQFILFIVKSTFKEDYHGKFGKYELVDSNGCFEFITRIIFKHGKNYAPGISEDKDRLFDKTKLNTFADHVSIIRSALEGLKVFLTRDQERMLTLNSLLFSDQVCDELSFVDSVKLNDIGDYSWRLKLTTEYESTSERSEVRDNSAIIDQALENILLSIDYFEKGYSNMLMDTNYTNRELFLYKRLSFVTFMVEYTHNRIQNRHLLVEIQHKLAALVNKSCSTSLLHKCLYLLPLN